MNKKRIKYIVTYLVVLNCFTLASSSALASTSYYLSSIDSSELYTDNKSKGFDVFNEHNYKYLSSEQKKELKEIKKCKDKGDQLSEDQQKALHSIINCIIKGRLGDQKYSDYNGLIEKKRSSGNLTEEENKRLEEYNDIIDGTKPTGSDILEQFLR